MTTRALLFDLDNTLIDFMKFKRECINSALDAMISCGLKVNKEKARKIIFDIYEKYGMEEQKIFQKFLKKVNGKIDYRMMSCGILAYKKTKESYMTPYSGTLEVLKKLKKKYKLAIISDAPGVNAWSRLLAMKIDKFFNVILTKSDVKSQKPSSRIFNVALRKLKVNPEEAVMVGDRIDRDIKGAKALGIKTVFARYGNPKVKKGKSGADWEIGDIKELMKVVKGK